MATFGRRPAKGLKCGGVSAVTTTKPARSTAPSRKTSSGSGSEDAEQEKRNGKPKLTGLALLQAEEAERERFAVEFERRNATEEKEQQAQQEAAERERREHLEMLAGRRGKPNPIVFLEVELRSRTGRVEAHGRLEIELFADQVPRTAENFRCLCTGEKGSKLHFKNSTFHRIIPGFMAQGGDITNGDGTGGLSIYGRRFADESFARLHARSNLLSMANSGPDSNNSQFFILFTQCKHLDRKHVVFGEIVREDGAIMKRIEAQGSETGEVNGSVVIVNSGELKPEDEEDSRRRFRRSPTRSASRRRKQRKCYI